MDLSIPEMTCGHCRAAVTEALTALDPAAEVAVDLAAKRVNLATTAAPTEVLRALKAVGFEAALV